ncbi:hypothetical protein GQ44DRAFT_13962 [Phaeosphaeriaceae sp. PMI808]|nr:hypothetical protein GQ44DRAFT_13962 [Phaeosphaeriaceae sp. PMI808]
MARINGAQTSAPKPSPKTKSQSNSAASALSIAAFLLFILVPLTIPIYWSDHFQQLQLILQTHLPNQLQIWLPRLQQGVVVENEHIKLSPEDLLTACEVHQYTSEIISLDPLVVYINNFTSSLEAEELINIGSPDFASSFISRSHGPNTLVSGRTSQSAPLDLDHPLVSCILSRARRFMGSMLLPHEPFSIPQLVRYFPSQKYDLHTDFWPEHQLMNDGSGRLFNRAASFFVFLRDNCTEGHTYFPRVELAGTNADNPASDEEIERWYGDKVARGAIGEQTQGVKFKPIQGNAVFWVNLNEKGEGDRRLIHAGLPVGEGEKIGLNLWPRKFYGTEKELEEKKNERKGWGGRWKE